MDWLYTLIGGAFLGLIALVWKLLNEKIEALWLQIGKDSNSGMRVHVHDIANVKTQNIAIHERLVRLETWRNGKS